MLQSRGLSLQLRREDVSVERPKNREHGDWASNLAMRFAKQLAMPPRELAEALVSEFSQIPSISHAEVAGPGFINLSLSAEASGALAKKIVEAGTRFGENTGSKGKSINLEFVSANPTGPMHLGHTRWAALGDSLARILKASGADLSTEFYINDYGNQLNNFGASVIAAAQGEPTPEGGYPGAYVQELAKAALAEFPNLLTMDDAEALALAREFAYRMQLKEIQKSLTDFRVDFDAYFSERTLHEVDPATGMSKIDSAVERLREQGHVFDEDGAVWVRTTDFGDDKDRVIRRSNGEYTYFAADAAYYLDKKDRGFFEKIYLLGADHHGYIHRLKALAGAAGDDPEKNITVLIGQLVNLNGAKLSKRAGNIIEINDLVEWLGTDALRYWLARYPADSPLELDGEKLRSQSNDNPVFYVQYAHARTNAVAKNAAASGVTRDVFAPETLQHETETALLGVLAEFERTVRMSAELREPHRVARYLETLAAAYHRWYDSCRVIPLGEEPIEAVHNSRLWLNDAAAQVLRNGLDLLGVSAPERM
ncbi:MAG: arginine--tRNA ligase [Microbacteriaceae bacterium]